MSGANDDPLQSLIKEGPGWETLCTERPYANPFIEVQLVRVRTPSRPGGAAWTVVHRKGAAIIAPMTPDGRLLLIRQERIPIRAAIWEFPAGQIDGATQLDDAAIRATACRELEEETGYELGPAGELIPMGALFLIPRLYR